jgi:Protein of unknown function (DUF2877)
VTVRARPAPIQVGRARTISSALLPLFHGAARAGVGLGRGYVDLGGLVLALTRPGQPRMPNGIGCDLRVERGEPCRIELGLLVSGETAVAPGPIWDPVPRPRVRPPLQPGWAFEPDVDRLAGRGEGLTPAGDDLLAGYAAALVLFHGRRNEAAALAEAAAARTTGLSATLLRHAARGELPEPAHALLERGDPAPLLCFGHSSGRCLMRGLAVGAAATG